MTTSVTTQFDLIEYFAALDPYSYSIDNRPLEDLKQNIDVLARAHDASLDAAKLAAVATGMLARGIVGENVMVGKKSLGSMNLVIDHGVFVREGIAYPSDPNAQLFPKLGLQQQSVVFALSAPVNPTEIKYFTISARFDTPSNSISFYDTTNVNTANSIEFGTVEYNPIQDVTVAGAFDTSYFPTPPLGFYALFHVAVPEGTLSLNSDMVTNVNFVDDLTRAYDSHTATTTGAATIEDITVNANYALVFINGVFQNSGTYTVNAPDSVTFSPALPSGLTVDFVTMRGGGGVGGGGGGSGTYSYETYKYTTLVPAEDTFTVIPPLDSDYVFVFVNGVFQGDIDRTIPGQVTIASPVPAGTVIDFVQTVGGSALPLGGTSGQSTHKSGAGPVDAWQTEVLSVNVNSASGVNPLAYVAAPTGGFSETYDLYEGRQIVLVNNGGFTSAPTNGGTIPTVTLQVGALAALPVTRAGNVPLKNNDVYSGAVVTYKAVPTPHFELVNPGMPDVVSTYSLVTGTQTNIEVTPSFPMLAIQNGTIFSIKPVNALSVGNDQELCTLKVNFATGSQTSIIGKMEGPGPVGLRIGDIQGTTNHLFQYNSALGYWILLNPARLPVLEVSGAKRQTVLSGPYYSQRDYTKVFFSGLARTPVLLDSQKPYSMKVVVSGPQRNLTINSAVTASFASGFSDRGPEDFVEVLPEEIVQDVELLDRGLTSANIQNVTLTGNNFWLTLNYSSAVNSGAGAVAAGHWVRIRGMVGDNTNPLIGLNGVYYVEAASTTSIKVSCQSAQIATVTAGIVNTVVDKVYFAYATRDPSGPITYGLSKYMPIYARSSVEDFSSPVSLSHLYVGQCIFDIDKMKMYEIQSGGVLLEVQRVFLGEIYVPDALTTFTYAFVNCYEYNGKYSAHLSSYGSAVDAFFSFISGTFVSFNEIPHGMGTYLYDLKMTNIQESLSSGRAVGALQAGTKFYSQQGVTKTEPIICRKDPTQLGFVLPGTVPESVGVSGYKITTTALSTPTQCNYLIELERSF